MELKKGNRFKDYIGNPCFISYIRKDVIKLSFLGEKPWVEVWDREDFIAHVNNKKFFPEPKLVINRKNIGNHLVEYQLNMIGKTSLDVKDDPFWFSNNSLTAKQHELFKSYAIPLIRKVFKCNKAKAEETFAWFDLGYGLTLKENNGK